MGSNSCRSSNTSIYMLSVTDIDPNCKMNPFPRSGFTPATFGHTGCWSMTKCRFSTNFSKSFDHHGTTKKEKKSLKMSFEMRKNLNFLQNLWVILIKTFSTTHWRMPVWKLQTWSQVYAKKCLPGVCIPSQEPTRTPCVSNFCFMGGEGTSNTSI